MDKYNNFSNMARKDNFFEDERAAYNLSLIEYDNNDTLNILSKNNENEKVALIIGLKKIESKKEADLILSHLINCGGRIREAVSFILSEGVLSDIYLRDEKSKEIILNAILDINPNVVRNVISFIKKSEILKEELKEPVRDKVLEILDKLKPYLKENSPHKLNAQKNSKNHAKNKLTFNLYWLLETISVFDVNKIQGLDEILFQTACFVDYTIREKTAKILNKMNFKQPELLRKLKNDENIYVKNQLLC